MVVYCYKSNVELSDYELHINALVHYWTAGTLLPSSQKEERFPLIEKVNKELKVINLGTEDDLHTLMKNRIYSQITLPSDKIEDLKEYCNEYRDWFNRIVSKPIPNKNNLAEVGMILYAQTNKKNEYINTKHLQKLFPNAIDVLRFATAISKEKYPNNDISLDKKPKFKTFSRLEKRMLIAMLANCQFLFNDIWKRKTEFKQLMRYINPTNIQKKELKRVELAFNNLANNKRLTEKGSPVRSANYYLNVALENEDLVALSEVATHYPGIFARQFVEALRKMPNKEAVAHLYKQVGAQIPIKTTLNLISYIERSDNNQYRIFSSKYENKSGVHQKYKAVLNKELGLSDHQKAYVAQILHESVVEALKGESSLGKVYIDESLKNNMIAGNETAKSSSKGSQLTFATIIPTSPEKNIIRPFIWWTNLTDKQINEYTKANDSYIDKRVDIDLSSMFFDENMSPLGHVSFTKLRVAYACHSGDIVDGGPAEGSGACEFIELDKEKLKEAGVFYVAITVHSYTDVPFKYGVGQFGFMEREGQLIDFHYYENDANDNSYKTSRARDFETSTGEIFEPSTVKYKIDLTQNATNTTPVIYDVVKNRLIWIDKSLGASLTFPTTEGTVGASSAITYKATHNLTNNMYELMKCQAEARATEIVTDITKADTVFVSKRIDAKALGLKEDVVVISAHDLDRINAEFMGGLQKETLVLEKEDSSVEDNRKVEEELIDDIL